MDTTLEIPNIITVPHDDDVKLELEHKPTPILTKKKHSPMRAFRVALHMMRGNSKKPNVISTDDETKNIWKKLVGSMRPLHLQSNQSPRLSSPQSNGQKFDQMTTTLPPPSPSESSGGGSVFVDFSTEEEPFSPFSPSPSSSRYASAVGLNELVSSDEENDRPDMIKEECDENGDDKIDSKAEDFIAQFYHQMRLQRFNNVDRDYQERSERSLGW
ncbi:uncharacterized protein LOC131612700 [Vicia villosa]|uniref:uncharacterized protein LOC131612700 n=1 Tax=Vicia villosa TaxID=3911 RepID=UPI00273BA974|nr:uncharacterized protein LOC131612700 [Vicia villosa]